MVAEPLATVVLYRHVPEQPHRPGIPLGALDPGLMPSPLDHGGIAVDWIGMSNSGFVKP